VELADPALGDGRAYPASVRTSAPVVDARGLGLRDHLCWGFDDQAELITRCCEFLVDGIRLGQKVSYVGEPGDRAAVGDGLRRAGVHQDVPIATLDEFYPAGTVIEPAAQVESYAAATAEAQQAGYTGLRVAVNATPLVRTPRQRDAFTRYEHLIDRFMRSAPFSALCGYDRRELGEEGLAELACLHPATNPEATQFWWHAGDRDHAGALAGELDLSTRRLFALAMERAQPQPENGVLAVDARGLVFIDHRHLLTLAATAERHGAELVLCGPSPGIRRIVEVLALPKVRVGVAG
jgi:anti-anti-sigma regulatory factor